MYHPGLDSSALPQDLYRIYSRPFASNAILRLRCSAGFAVARCHVCVCVCVCVRVCVRECVCVCCTSPVLKLSRCRRLLTLLTC